jgi:uncharacterized protein YxjI
MYRRGRSVPAPYGHSKQTWRVFKLDGKVLRIRKTILFQDTDRRELRKIQERMMHILDIMEIEVPDRNGRQYLISLAQACHPLRITQARRT